MILSLGRFERKREPADIGHIHMFFGKRRNEFRIMTEKKEDKKRLYTHTQAPNARTLQDFPWSIVVVVMIMMYIYITTILFWPFPSAIYVCTHLTVETSSCT